SFAAGTEGTNPDQGIPLTGTLTGKLAPGQTVWFNYWHNADFNEALVLKSNPAMAMPIPDEGSNNGYNNGGVFFNVEWTGLPSDQSFPGGMFGEDLAGYFRVGQSTQSGLPDGTILPNGTQYWQQGKSANSIPFSVAVVNNTTATVSYALTLVQSNDAMSA